MYGTGVVRNGGGVAAADFTHTLAVPIHIPSSHLQSSRVAPRPPPLSPRESLISQEQASGDGAAAHKPSDKELPVQLPHILHVLQLGLGALQGVGGGQVGEEFREVLRASECVRARAYVKC